MQQMLHASGEIALQAGAWSGDASPTAASWPHAPRAAGTASAGLAANACTSKQLKPEHLRLSCQPAQEWPLQPQQVAFQQNGRLTASASSRAAAIAAMEPGLVR